MMKKIVSMMLIAVMALMLYGCGNHMTAAENFLLAVKAMDVEAMKKELVADTGTGTLYTKLDMPLSADEKETLQKLYALTQYTIGEQTEEDGVRFVNITLKVPDMERIIGLTKTKILVSAESAEKVIDDMIDNGTVAKTLMLEKTLSVKMTASDGAWRIPYEDAENEVFRMALMLSEMLTFITAD